MKRWTGGTLIALLALLLFLSYTAYTLLVSTIADAITTPAPSQEEEDRPEVPTFPPIPFRKPHLLSRLQGLDALFPSPANASGDREDKLAWTQMRALLLRSDALPDTANGVREAAVAWKELVAAVETEREAAAANETGAENRHCPFSVSANGSSGSLEIPCGFVQDSAITVVGVPNGRGSFQIELVGSQLPGEREAPVVLHYSVSLGSGDEGPMIVQNTWTAKHGWGVEERCPSPGLKPNLTVDGLIRCSEHAGGTEGNVNVSTNVSEVNGKKSLDVSKGSSPLSVNFPFVEEHPFTATLWAGPVGFHMTVNGKRETSFAYREGLEPWMVNGVRVVGDLDLLSSLANGLPVSEDIDLVVDVDNLKAPLLPKKRLFLLVGVFSTGNNFERRMAIRRSWMQYKAVRSGDVAVRFFTGLHKNRQVNLELWKEAQTYGDMQLMPFVDYYSLITLKTIAICIFGTKVVPAKYIMKTDDDAFVRIDEVISSLKKSPSSGLLFGLISYDSAPHRDKDSKWFISAEEWPHASYPPWAHGPGYIISRDIAKFVVHGHQELSLQLFKLEDVAMGIWIQGFKKAGQEVNYVSDDHFHNAGCEGGYVLAHYQGPRLMLCLWEKLLTEHEPICCE
uniref:Putative beta-1,3-galactosyltransferase 16 n=1 Tax=Anthurium amnicola TaxID=1678845 RepID=A0A1D1YU00_9ARAE